MLFLVLLVLEPVLGFERFLFASLWLFACARAVGCRFLSVMLLIRWFLLRAEAPFPSVLGEVLSVFCLF